jgi:gliding motility-associated-like protein
MLTINQLTGNVEMTWSLSPSPDVVGYIVYLYVKGEGHPIDSIFSPTANSYFVNRPGTSRFSESYVIAAIDNSHNYSPLSNELQTIFVESALDSCNKKINISWNKYLSEPVKVTGYDVFASVNSGTYYLAGNVSSDITNFVIDDFINGSEYCFLVKANLENGMVSVSTKSCVAVEIQNPPGWINADYATVTEAGEIALSFTIDPASGIDLFRLERRSGASGSFQELAQIRTVTSTVTYTDKSADLNAVNTYRLSAINSCGVQAVFSNPASNILLIALNNGNEIVLKWNENRKWRGSVSSYRLFTDTGKGFSETAVLNSSDTIYSINIPEIMYTLSEGKACFYIQATETGNPFGITGESSSTRACITLDEVITVPNVFTPDGDLKNDLFRPVLTFTPEDYHIVIADRQGRILFETRDFEDVWDGSGSGSPAPEGVYLWFLKVRTPTGKSITRTGTITLFRKR